MKTLKHVKIGWKALQSVINDLIDAINERSISVSLGGGLDIQESPNGALLSTSAASLTGQAVGQVGKSPDTTDPGTGDGSGGGGDSSGGTGFITTAPGGGSAGWLLINVVIETGTGYQMRQVWMWGSALPL